MHIQGPKPLSPLNKSELNTLKPVQSDQAVPLPPPESEICCTDHPKFQKFSDYDMAQPKVHLCAWEPDQENQAPKVMRCAFEPDPEAGAPKVMRCAFEPDRETQAPKIMRCAWESEITAEPRPHLDESHRQPSLPREGIYHCSLKPERAHPRDPEITGKPRPHLDESHRQPSLPRDGIYHCSFKPERVHPRDGIYHCSFKPEREDNLPPQTFKCVTKR